MPAKPEGDSWLLREVSPSFLFLFGLALAPALWLQGSLAWKTGQALLFFALAARAHPRGRWRAGLASLIFLAVTIVLNLAVPLGRVLWQVGAWKITQGALESGLGKGLTLVGLSYLSRYCVRPELRLPGTVGRYAARTFFYLNRLLELRETIVLSRLTETLDRLLEMLWAQSPAQNAAKAGRGPRAAAAYAVLGGLLAANYGILFF